MIYISKILNVLCEGQTEERFVKEVLKPYLQDKGLVVKQRLLETNRKKATKGGMISYQQVKNDLTMWVKENSSKKGEKHFYTTMFDLYALPNDFPSFQNAQQIADKYIRVNKLETDFARDINISGLIPYIQLHEFEALVFCGLDKLTDEYPDSKKEINKLKEVLALYDNNPEMINNSSTTAPSKRIINALQNKYNYNKSKSGTYVTQQVGIDALRKQCPHFNEWLSKIENV